MSGGSYDYLRYKLEDDPLNGYAMSKLADMVHDLSDPLSHAGRLDAAPEIGAALNGLRAELLTLRKRALKRVEAYAELIEAVEWTVSGDRSSMRYEWNRFNDIPNEDKK
jgi:hypothetical protein